MPARSSACGLATGGPRHLPAAMRADVDVADAPAGGSVRGSTIGGAGPEALAGGCPSLAPPLNV